MKSPHVQEYGNNAAIDPLSSAKALKTAVSRTAAYVIDAEKKREIEQKMESPPEQPSRMTWGVLTSKALKLENSKKSLTAFNTTGKSVADKNHDSSKPPGQSFAKRASPGLPSRTSGKLTESQRLPLSRTSSLMWQQAVHQVARSHGVEGIEISAGRDTIRSFNRQILNRNKTSFNATTGKSVIMESLKKNDVSMGSNSDIDDSMNVSNGQITDEDVLPKRLSKAYTLGYFVRSVILPTFRNSFNGLLEELYNRYFFLERRWSLLAMLILIILQNMVQLVYYASVASVTEVTTTAATIILLSIVVVLTFRCDDPCSRNSSGKLRLYGSVTWLIIVAFSVLALFNTTQEQRAHLTYLSDGMPLLLCFVFVTYTMLPLPLTWSACLALMQTTIELLGRIICYRSSSMAPSNGDVHPNTHPPTVTMNSTNSSFMSSEPDMFARYTSALILVTLCVHLAGVWTGFLMERAQRQTYIEVRQCLKTRLKIEKENYKQEKLIFSVIPRFIALQMISDMPETDNDRPQSSPKHRTKRMQSDQINKLYVKKYENVSILYGDMKGFTELSSALHPQELVSTLNEIFARFDRLAQKHNCLRIKILGDCYYCVSGVPEPRQNHAHCCVEMGLGMIEELEKLRRSELQMRIGVHTGTVLCGVLGLTKWQFDIWSKDVIIANAMESGGVPGRVHVTEAVYDCISSDYEVEPGYGERRSVFLQQLGIKTFLIKHRHAFVTESKVDTSEVVYDATVVPVSEPSVKPHRLSSSATAESFNTEILTTPIVKMDNTDFPCKHSSEQSNDSIEVFKDESIATQSSSVMWQQQDSSQIKNLEKVNTSNLHVTPSHENDLLRVTEMPNRPRVPSIIVNQLFSDCSSMKSTNPVDPEDNVESVSGDSRNRKKVIQRRWRIPVTIFKFIGTSSISSSRSETEEKISGDRNSRVDGMENAEGRSSKRTGKDRLGSYSTNPPSPFTKSSAQSRRTRLTSRHDSDWKAELPFENLLSISSNRRRSRKKSIAMNKSQRNSPLATNLTAVTSSTRDYEEINNRLMTSISSGNYTNVGKKQIKNIGVTFANADLESQFSHLRDELFKSNLLLSCLVVFFILAIQACITPAEKFFNFINITLFVVVYGGLMFVIVAEDHPSIPKTIRVLSSYIQESIGCRYLIIYVALFLNLTIAITGMLSCLRFEGTGTKVFVSCGAADNVSVFSYSAPTESLCNYPNFFLYIGVLVLITCSVFLRVHNFIKLMNLGLVIFTFGIIALVFLSEIFTNFEVRKRAENGTCSGATFAIWDAVFHWLTLLLFGILVYYQNRRIEYTTRLDFIRKLEATLEVEGMKRLKRRNRELLRNILPDHVATHFLKRTKDDEGLYSSSHDCVGVMFASIPNFNAGDNSENVDSLKLLNEIIFDIDQLIGQERFRCLEKIKTIGSTYMAASGLTPHNIRYAVPGTENHGSRWHEDCISTETEFQTVKGDTLQSIKASDISHISMLAHFSLLLQRVITDINLHSYNDFSMRIGIAFGPLVAGVIGAKKPQYDIWGKTVNLASRMESTGVTGQIQVPEEVYHVLQPRGFQFKQRGRVNVKGIGAVHTYFLTGCTDEASKQAGMNRALSDLGTGIGADGNLHIGDASANGGHHSLADVVYRLVQARHRHKRYGAASGRNSSGRSGEIP